MSIFSCSNCGAQSPSWVGKCPECGQWNTYAEEVNRERGTGNRGKKRAESGERKKAVSISEVSLENSKRQTSGIGELDRALGGGIVEGSVILIAGEPGIGKSTLMTQIAGSLSKNKKVLYVCGEESPKQIKLRADRLGINSKGLLLFPETDLFSIEDSINNEKPDFIIIDSIQTIESENVQSGAGSVPQLKDCAAYLTGIAKTQSIPMFIVGQVTKDGAVAGPRILEHMVDTVLYFEGEKTKNFRLLRTVKNRFGAAGEVGVFEMTEKGLAEVKDPSGLLLDESSLGKAGSVVTLTSEGSRTMAVEVQALVSYSKLVSPRRTISGLDYNRCSVILGVLERKAGVKLSDSDVYISLASGMYSDEPAVDLPAAIALASCVKNVPVDSKTVVIGEIGLTGEIRAVSRIEQRLNEAAKLGFTTAIIPEGNAKALSKKQALKLVPVSSVKEAVEKAV